MNYSKDYENIRMLIDEIIGIDTQIGSNLKTAVKKYFEFKPIDVKLVSPKVEVVFDNRVQETYTIKTVYKEADEALAKYSEKLKKESDLLKEKGEWCGTSS